MELQELSPGQGENALLADSVVLPRVDKVIGWARKFCHTLISGRGAALADAAEGRKVSNPI